ncbi:catalase [Paraburkholderia atlantica]
MNNIDAGNFPKWRFAIQVMPDAEAASYLLGPFDIMKVWSQEDYPLIDVGTTELIRNAATYFANTEQPAFRPANVVPASASHRAPSAAVTSVLVRRHASLSPRHMS